MNIILCTLIYKVASKENQTSMANVMLIYQVWASYFNYVVKATSIRCLIYWIQYHGSSFSSPKKSCYIKTQCVMVIKGLCDLNAEPLFSLCT